MTIQYDYISFTGIIMARNLILKDVMINQIISFILLTGCIIDYLKCNHFSNEKITIISFIVVLVLASYSQKLKILGIEFVRSKENKKKKVPRNVKQNNSACKKELR